MAQTTTLCPLNLAWDAAQTVIYTNLKRTKDEKKI